MNGVKNDGVRAVPRVVDDPATPAIEERTPSAPDLGPAQVPDASAKIGVGRRQLVRAREKGPIRGVRALRAATGLDGFVPLRHLNTLDGVRSVRKKLAGESTEALVARFDALRSRLASGAKRKDIKTEAIAIGAEMMKRTLNMEPRDEQLLVTIAMVDGCAAELATGEGKTLAMGMAAAVIGLEGKGVHVLTANSYLAERDADTVAPFLEALNMSAGVVTEAMMGDYDGKRAAYAADVTFGDVATVAFDWLEDQTWWMADARVMRPLHMALVDEADHVMLDNAQKPLVLSRPAPDPEKATPNIDLMQTAKAIVDQLDPTTDVIVYVEGTYPRAHLSAEGQAAFELAAREKLGLSEDETVWDTPHLPLLRELLAAIDARFSIRRNHEYIRTQDDIVLIDPTTDRPNPGGRLRHGVHNAVRLREGLPPEPELETIGMGSFQHFLRAYQDRGATTGTADGAKEELRQNYGLELVRIPTHRDSLRVDMPDRMFVHPALRDAAAIADLIVRHERGQPILVSCDSVQASKRMASLVRDPMLALAGAMCSSSSMLAKAASSIEGADEIMTRAAAYGRDEERIQLAASLADRMREDPNGTKSAVALLAEAGLDLSPLLRHEHGLVYSVLDAENATHEAEVITKSGQPSAIIISTQMAGRGSDIQVPDAVLEVGGLHVIGIERKVNARMDRQLVGRSGRCGEIGSSQFFLSPSDTFLAFLAARDRRALAKRLDDSPPELVSMSERRPFTRAVKAAQEKAALRAEGERRVNLRLDESIEYQRKEITSFRQTVLEDPEPMAMIEDWIWEWLSAQLPEEATADEARRVIDVFDPGQNIDLGDLGDGLFDAEELFSRLIPHIRTQFDDVHTARGESRDDAKQHLRGMIMSHVDREWLGLLRAQENLRSTAAMRAQFDMFTDHARGMAGEFRTMTLTMRNAVIEQLAFDINQPPS